VVRRLCDLENLKNEEAMARVGPQRHRKKKINSLLVQLMALFQVPRLLVSNKQLILNDELENGMVCELL